MHLDNYGLKAIRAIYFEKLRLYEDSTKYANDVDVSRSHENVLLNVDDLIGANSINDIHEVDYDFTPNNKKNKTGKFDTYKKYNDDIKKRIVKITGEPPKNNVHVGSIVFTLPDEFKNSSKKEQVDVFKNWLRFIGDRYGNENIIDCVLHFDETTPHGTVTIVPEAISRKTHKKTVSTASCFTKKDLNNLHKDCDAYFERIYGVEGLINNQKTIGKTKVAKQHLGAFKKERAEYEALTKQNRELNAENQRLQDVVTHAKNTIDEAYNTSAEILDEANDKANNTLDEANNEAKDIKSKAEAEAERIKQTANVGINKRIKELDTRERNIEAREDKYTKDTDTFYKVTYPKYKKDKKDLDDKEKELDERKKGLDTRAQNITAREDKYKEDADAFYKIIYPKYENDKKDLEDKEKELKKFEEDVAEYLKYKPLHRDTVTLDAFGKSDYFKFPIKDVNDFIKTFKRQREDMLYYMDLYHAYEKKYGALNKSEKPYERAKSNIDAIMEKVNKQVAEWEEQQRDEGFTPLD